MYYGTSWLFFLLPRILFQFVIYSFVLFFPLCFSYCVFYSFVFYQPHVFDIIHPVTEKVMITLKQVAGYVLHLFLGGLFRTNIVR